MRQLFSGRLFAYELAQTSTNSYVTEILAYVLPWQNKIVYVKENNVNAISYSVDGSMDGTDWHNLVTDVAVAKNGDSYQTLTDAWVWLRVQIKSTVAATHSTDVDVYIGAN